MNRPFSNSSRIYTLDVLRGVAALSVVFWHWQHFFYEGNQPAGFDRVRQPFYDALALFYHHGALAVELFFCISGFVFFYLFFNQIAERKISASRFFMDRFSRLYPLHIASFVLVAGLQYVYARDHSTYFVYQFNDLYHAVLNVLLIPAWGFEAAPSFNGPVWSVSVEMLLYGVFFLLCLTGKARYLLIPGLIALAWYMYPEHYKLAAGVFCFFCGGVAYLLLERLITLLGGRASCALTLAVAVATWLWLWWSPVLNMYLIMGIALPASVMFVASLSELSPTLMKRFGAVGDVSYSSYLLHFPLQIVFAMITDSLGYSRDVFYSPWLLVLFMAVLIPLSFASHRLFEAPVQRALRRRFKSWSGRQAVA